MIEEGFISGFPIGIFPENVPEFDYLKPLLTIWFLTGWSYVEYVGPKWSQVKLEEGIMRLEPGETKNGKGRTLFLEPELMDLFKDLLRNRRLDCQLVFHRDGTKIGDFRKSWNTACEQAKIPKMLFHDLRRSEVRNMIRAGIPETVAMAISGHKTRAVFDRYNITSDEDLKDAAKKRQAFTESQGRQVRFSYVLPNSREKAKEAAG